jgi:hypothetical protein
MIQPPPLQDVLDRQVALMRAMGGPELVRGYSRAEMSLARDRIALAIGRAAERATWRPLPRTRP